MSGSPAAPADHGADARTDSGASMQMICPKTSATSGVSLLIIPVCPQLKAPPGREKATLSRLEMRRCLARAASGGKGKTKEAQNPLMRIQNATPAF